MKSILLASAITLVIVGNAYADDTKWSNEEATSGVKKIEYTRYAMSGKTLRVAFMYAINIDCSLAEGYYFEIAKEPEHGTAKIEPQTDFPSFAKDNPRFKCNTQQVEAPTLIYKPTDGYEGRDSFILFELWPSGVTREITYIFNVRSFKEKRAVKIDGERVPSPLSTIRSKSK